MPTGPHWEDSFTLLYPGRGYQNTFPGNQVHQEQPNKNMNIHGELTTLLLAEMRVALFTWHSHKSRECICLLFRECSTQLRNILQSAFLFGNSDWSREAEYWGISSVVTCRNISPLPSASWAFSPEDFTEGGLLPDFEHLSVHFFPRMAILVLLWQ